MEDVDGSHVAYSEECQEDFNECFDFDCPVSHPVKMPEIHLYTRVVNYEGGAHVFANDTDVSGIMRILIILTTIVDPGFPQRLLLWVRSRVLAIRPGRM